MSWAASSKQVVCDNFIQAIKVSGESLELFFPSLFVNKRVLLCQNSPQTQKIAAEQPGVEVEKAPVHLICHQLPWEGDDNHSVAQQLELQIPLLRTVNKTVPVPECVSLVLVL